MKKEGTIFVFAIIFLVSLQYASAEANVGPSNESIKARDKITSAQECFNEMKTAGVPLARANESLEEGSQIYAAQVALEGTNRKSDYNVVIADAEEVCNVKSLALQAKDELGIFLEAYNTSAQNVNLSAMQETYDALLASFKEERFEETLQLIDKAYEKLSEVESSQTTLRLFYSSTSKSIKQFFKDNWKVLLIGLVTLIIVLFIFWKAIKRIRVKMKIRHLLIQKDTLKNLIAKLQRDYFDNKTLPESEYAVKLTRFKEMIRDIDRQIPLLREELMRLGKKDEKVEAVDKEKLKKSVWDKVDAGVKEHSDRAASDEASAKSVKKAENNKRVKPRKKSGKKSGKKK